jgi:uncharacterized protein
MDAIWPILVRFGEFSAIFLAVAFAAHLLVRGLPPARLRAALGDRPVRSTVAALLLGALTPFCSCSTVPLTAGLAAAGVPVVATTAFLVVSPLVNPATVALLATLGSPLLAAGFVLASLTMALVVALTVAAAGVRPRSQLAAVAGAAAAGAAAVGAHDTGAATPQGAPRRAAGALVRGAAQGALQDFRRLLPVVIVVIALAAALSGRVDIGAVGRAMDAAGPFAVPLAVLIGVPVYASTAVLLPLGAALLAGGAGLGVVSAFLIGATGLSLPEGVLLHRLMGGRYLATVAATFVVAAVGLGYLIEALAGAPLSLVSALP